MATHRLKPHFYFRDGEWKCQYKIPDAGFICESDENPRLAYAKIAKRMRSFANNCLYYTDRSYYSVVASYLEAWLVPTNTTLK